MDGLNEVPGQPRSSTRSAIKNYGPDIARLSFLACCVVVLACMAVSALRLAPVTLVHHHTMLDVADGRSLKPLMHSWKDCSHGMYLDVGTNVGVQIRKLYEPEKFPGAHVLPIFDKYFGPRENRSKVCAVGFEPNSAHTAYLNKLNAHFKSKSLPAYVFTDVAVSSRRGNTTFFMDPDAPQDKHEWAASLATRSNKSITVQLVDLHNFILEVVVPIARLDHANTGKLPPIIMKMDIEGAEYVVFPAMIVSGALCHLDHIFAEWHGDGMRQAIPGSTNLTKSEILYAFESMRVTNPGCNVVFNDLDDETFVDGTAIPL